MSFVRKSGLVLYYTSDSDVYFRCMIPSDPLYGGSSPQIPKGTIECSDTIEYTAFKECIEEVGLVHDNIKSFEYFKTYKNMKMAIFIGTVKDTELFNEPHWESKWSGWVSYNHNKDKLRNLQRHIFDDIAEYINQGISQ